MLIAPIRPSHRPRPRYSRARLIHDQRLAGTIERMISANALSAFTAQIAGTGGIGGPAQPVRGTSPLQSSSGASAQEQGPAQRRLDSMPAQPAAPMPRGSLLDLRV
jgi:hypothetical protein